MRRVHDHQLLQAFRMRQREGPGHHSAPIVSRQHELLVPEMLGQGAELTFLRDRDTQRLVIQLVDPKTKEVIQQIPPEYVLKAAEQLFAKRSKDEFK